MKSRVYIGKEIVTYVNNVEQSLDVTDDFMPESYSGSTAISKTVSVGSIPTSGAKLVLSPCSLCWLKHRLP